MFENLINAVTNYDYGLLVLKGVVKATKVTIEILKWVYS